jgi:hemolysin-activating ACP:hemolysin acyltransferase
MELVTTINALAFQNHMSPVETVKRPDQTVGNGRAEEGACGEPEFGKKGAAGAASAGYRLFRPNSPLTALGLAVNYLMTKPAFAQLGFGAWSRILVGQINRGHYRFVLDDGSRVTGFLGWALVDEAGAESWLRGSGGFRDIDGKSGDCIVFNAWASNTASANRFVLIAAREAMLGCRLGYFKRYYDDGGIRPMRMNVNDFVGRHLGRDS